MTAIGQKEQAKKLESNDARSAERSQGHPKLTTKQIGRAIGVSYATTKRADYIVRHGSPELVAAVEDQSLTLTIAERLCRLVSHNDDQRELLSCGIKAVKQFLLGGETPEPFAGFRRMTRSYSREGFYSAWDIFSAEVERRMKLIEKIGG